MRVKDTIAARAAAYVAVYPMLLQIAKDHGYTLAVHGSLHRDLDLVAIPWIEEASDALTLIKALKAATGTGVHCLNQEDDEKFFPECSPSKKPHGRVCYSLHCTNDGGYGPYFDISVMPLAKEAA